MARPLLWHSNAPWARTGYGAQTKLFAPRIHEAGYPTAISAFYGLQGGTVDLGDIRVYPSGYENYGADTIAPHAAHHFKGDRGLIFTLVDAWVLPAERLKGMDVAMWVPVDHDPVPPAVVEVIQRADAVPVAMSRFGERALRTAGLDPLYVSHGVDTAVFQPKDRREARASTKLREFPEDAFIVGMVAANKGIIPPRKGWDVAIQAFARLRQQNPKAHLYLHTEPFGLMDGVHLPSLLQAAGVPEDACRFAEPYRYSFTGYSDDDMANIYSGIDVLLNPALGEGFGIPILEAQACGTPVIVTDFSAMTEVGDNGWHVSGQRVWTQQRSWMMAPDLDQVAGCLSQAAEYGDRMRESCVEHAAKYEVDRVMAEHMLPCLEECERRFDARRNDKDPAQHIDTSGPVEVETAA